MMMMIYGKTVADRRMQITVSYEEYIAIVGHLCLVAKLCRLMNISSKVGSRKATTCSCILIYFEFLRKDSNRQKDANNCFLSRIRCNCRAFMLSSEITSFHEHI